MPVMGGAEAFTRIRELRPTLPVIASSGCGESEIIGQFRGSGVTAFLQKPYTAARLRQVVADALMCAERPPNPRG